MNRPIRLIIQSDHGFSLIELLVVAFIFVLMALMIDVVFATVNRSSRTVGLAADVQQNGRIAVERLSREVVSSRAPEEGGTWIKFRSARPESNTRVFCLDVTTTSDPLHNPACNYPSPTGGTYTPVWQAWIVYWFDGATAAQDCAANTGVLKRIVQTQEPTPPFTGGDIIAACVESFDVSLSGNILTVSLDLAATGVAQGAEVPVQRLTVEGRVLIRN